MTQHDERATATAVTRPEPLPLPKAVRDMLRNRWRQGGGFLEMLEHHAEADRREGGIVYGLGMGDEVTDMIYGCSDKEMRALAATLPEGFARLDGNAWINQHAWHSLQDFMHEVGVLYAEHLQRLEALRGTPAGPR